MEEEEPELIDPRAQCLPNHAALPHKDIASFSCPSQPLSLEKKAQISYTELDPLKTFLFPLGNGQK